MILILKKSLWCYAHTLLVSDLDHYAIVHKYLITKDAGEFFPIFSCITYENNNVQTEGIICSYDKTTRNKLQIFLRNGVTVDTTQNKVVEFVEQELIFISHTAVVTDGLNFITPRSDDELKKRHDLIEYDIADQIEMKNIIVDHDCFSELLKNRPENAYVHTSKVVRTKNYFADGSFKKYKSRWTIRGFTFRHLYEYFRTYAPVAGLISLKIFFVLCIYYGLITEQWDVTSAYLLPEFDGEVWIKFPENWSWNGNTYGKLKHNIYGTPQSAELFYKLISTALFKAGCTRNPAEPTLFYYFTPKIKIIFLVHVDNFHVGSNDVKYIKWFFTTQMGGIKFVKENSQSVLGVHVEHPEKGVYTFSMEFYILKLADRFKIVDKRPAIKVPITTQAVEKLLKLPRKTTVDTSIPMMELVMSLFWLGRNVRYDILFACIFYATFSHCYTQEVFDECLNVLYYLLNTLDAKLVYRDNGIKESCDIKIVVDASYGKFPVGCAMVYLNGCLIHFGIERNKGTSITETDQLTSSMHGEVAVCFIGTKLGVHIYEVVSPITKVILPILIHLPSSNKH